MILWSLVPIVLATGEHGEHQPKNLEEIRSKGEKIGTPRKAGFFSFKGPQISTKNLGTLPKVLFIYHSNRANLEISLLQPSTKRRGTTRTIMRDLRSVAQKLMHLGSNDRPPNFTMEFWWNFWKPKKLQSGKLTHETIMLNRKYIFKFGPCFIAMLVY